MKSMKEIDKSVKAHLLVCCRQRDGKPCCSSKGAEELVTNLKSWVKNNGLKDEIKVTKSSCLGHCENGITATLYPHNKWWVDIDKSHEDELKSQLLKTIEPC